LDTLYRQIREDLQQIPGVASVSYAMYTPMNGNNWEGQVNVEGRAADANDYAVYVRVGPDYFSSIGTKILQGRPITEHDTATSQPVAIVNAEFVKRYFDAKNALGRHFGQGGTKHVDDFEIVGVTENTNYWGPGEEMRPMYFVAAPQEIKNETLDGALTDQRSMYMGNIVLHATGGIADLERQVRRVLGNINPDLPVTEIHPFERQVQRNLDQQRMIAQGMTVFGFLALLLATVGLYGVTSYGVKRRTNEIGVRMALGADRTQVVGMVIREVAIQSVVGLIIGLPLVFVAGRVLASKLPGVNRFDFGVVIVAITALVVSAVIAGFLPARRAAGIEPMQALRAE
jgi:predicted permease